MEKAIKKAIEGGWEYLRYSYQNTPCCEIKGEGESYHKDILLDPLFWQAIFKENGKIRAVEFMGFIYVGGKIDDYFDEKLN